LASSFMRRQDMPKAPRRANLKSPGSCIFCGRPGLTDEHIFSDWLRELFPRTAHDRKRQADILLDSEHKRWSIPLPRLSQGHIGSKKLHVTCERCNTGWISIIDNAPKIPLTRLINGEIFSLDRIAQHQVATWITKLVIISEYLYPDNRAVSDAEKCWFWGWRMPFHKWKIWIAHYHGLQWRELYTFHHMLRFDLDSPKRVTEASRNFHSTTIGMGNLLIHVMGTSADFLSFDLDNDAVSDLARIWPIRQTNISWPAGWPPIGDREADNIAHTLSRIGDHPDAHLR
jgi:hypothetical protein